MQATVLRVIGVMLPLTVPAFAANAPAVATRPALATTQATVAQCRTCHSCDEPTPRNPCLIPCLRKSDAAIALEFSGRHGPNVVILNELEDRYLPVPFDHKGHAGMAEMTKGCATCHHYTPEGASHPACRTCHEVSPAREDMRKPGLKGAYHRQCMSCHREWDHETQCEICHPSKTSYDRANGVKKVPSKDDIVGHMHPPIPEPDTEIYQTPGQSAKAGKVIFRHKEHIHRFGLKCVECHREDTCQRCHEEGRTHEQKVRTLDDHHQPCFACHATSPCERCHWEEGKPKPEPFDHASTGWPLGRRHAAVECRKCHKTVPFIKQDRQCVACHAGWKPGAFDHGKATGLTLDDNHAETECEQCHLERKFDAKPVCTECHDKEFTYPARKPGKLADKP